MGCYYSSPLINDHLEVRRNRSRFYFRNRFHVTLLIDEMFSALSSYINCPMDLSLIIKLSSPRFCSFPFNSYAGGSSCSASSNTVSIWFLLLTWMSYLPSCHTVNMSYLLHIALLYIFGLMPSFVCAVNNSHAHLIQYVLISLHGAIMGVLSTSFKTSYTVTY